MSKYNVNSTPAVRQRRTTSLSDEQVENQLLHQYFLNQYSETYHTDNTRERHDPRIAPPLLSPHTPSSAPESISLTSHGIRLVDQKLDSLSASEHRVNVLNHDGLSVVCRQHWEGDEDSSERTRCRGRFGLA